jgi:hypothetical protein
MPLHPRQVRFTPVDEEWIARHAAELGETFSEYVRKAALARAWMDEARLRPETVPGAQTVYEAAGRLLGEETDRRRSSPQE